MKSKLLLYGGKGVDSRGEALRESLLPNRPPPLRSELPPPTDQEINIIEVSLLLPPPIHYPLPNTNPSTTNTINTIVRYPLYHFPTGPDPPKIPTLTRTQTHLRTELQTVHRLPQTKAILCAFHTSLYPLSAVKEEGLGDDLAQAVEGLREGSVPRMWWYKRAVVWGVGVAGVFDALIVLSHRPG